MLHWVHAPPDILWCSPRLNVGSVMLFNLYMLPLAGVINRYNISSHQYADDLQLYLSLAPDDYKSISTLVNCVESINLWMAQIFLQLNKDKTEVLDAQRKFIMPYLDSLSRKANDCVKSWGIVFDSKRADHLRNTSKAGDVLSPTDSERLMHALLASRLEYCCSVSVAYPRAPLHTYKEFRMHLHECWPVLDWRIGSLRHLHRFTAYPCLTELSLKSSDLFWNALHTCVIWSLNILLLDHLLHPTATCWFYPECTWDSGSLSLVIVSLNCGPLSLTSMQFIHSPRYSLSALSLGLFLKPVHFHTGFYVQAFICLCKALCKRCFTRCFINKALLLTSSPSTR